MGVSGKSVIQIPELKWTKNIYMDTVIKIIVCTIFALVSESWPLCDQGVLPAVHMRASPWCSHWCMSISDPKMNISNVTRNLSLHHDWLAIIDTIYH